MKRRHEQARPLDMRLFAVLSLLCVAPVGAEVIVGGSLALDATAAADSARSWVDGGWGRLLAGAGDGEEDLTGALTGELSVDWRPTLRWRFYAHGLARAESDSLGDALGIVEAFAELGGTAGQDDEWRVRAGAFFPPTSFENVEARWSSPYTLSLSVINSWVAEEARDVGVEGRWIARLGDQRLVLGLGALGGNDTSGALLAWRGFAVHDRLTVVGEVLPLPNLAGLRDPGGFAEQRDDGTRPVGEDLDGRLGWSARLRWIDDGRGAAAQLRVADNRGDREIYRGEYAWRTRTVALGGTLPVGDWTLVGELLAGDTGMGVPPALVDVDFRALYLLASWARDGWRATLRWDRFETRDRDGSAFEVSDEDGDALTLALLRETASGWWVGVEGLVVAADRPRASGFTEGGDGRALRLEVRRTF